jgi:predicted ribonuclease toxin of YeeF-YezG toxin-antitoxin module
VLGSLDAAKDLFNSINKVGTRVSENEGRADVGEVSGESMNRLASNYHNSV